MKIALLRYDEIHREQWKPELCTLSESDYEQLVNGAVTQSIAQGLIPHVVTFDPERYTDWLGEREDTSDLRAAWASNELK